MKTTLYEWCIEQFDEAGDIINLDFYDSLKEAPKEELRLCFDKTSSYQLCFVMRKGNEALGEVDRRVVYVNSHNEMPDTFDEGTKIPKKYTKQFKSCQQDL